MIIYKITNKINGKIYIGQTIVKLSKRRDGHYADSKRDRKNKAKSKISKAIAKYGIDSFVFEEICSAKTQEELNKLEEKYINIFKSLDDTIGYNLLSGGHQNGKHSEETKLKISIASKRKSDEAKSKGQHWNTGRHHTDEHKAKISAKIKGVPCPQRANTYSEEDRRIISERMKLIRKNRFWSTKTVTSV